MSKDEQIQHLREQLARAEGERDAYKAMTTRRHEVVTAPYTPRPYVWPTYGYMCASCGQWATAGHTCWTWANVPAYVVSVQGSSDAISASPVSNNFLSNAIGADGGESNE